jgi:hypothetical protein
MEKMKTKLVYFTLFLLIAIIASSVSCVRKAATVQPGYKPPILESYYGAGVLILNPGDQKGKTLPVSYDNTLDGERIISTIAMEEIKPGDSGSISWMLKNAGYNDAQLILTADIAPLPSVVTVGAASASYIGVKLKCDDSYVLGDNLAFVPLSKLTPYLKDQFRILAGGAVTFYELEWQVPQNPFQAGPDGFFSTADDIPVDTLTLKQDKSELDISFGLLVPESAK